MSSDATTREDGTAVDVRAESADDHDAIAEVVRRAFGSNAEAELVDAIRSSPQYVPGLALVAEQAGEVVGHVMISHVTLDDGGTERRIASLSPLAVAPERQRSGIGSVLVRTACARAADLGEPAVILEGNPDYYGRFGFEPGLRYGITFELPSWAPPEAGQVLWLADRDPALRGRVVYPPSFAGVVEHDQ